MKQSKRKNRKNKKNRNKSVRSCEECVECCVVLQVTALNKSKHVRCDNLCNVSHGCKIYNDRPKECADFQCLWTVDKNISELNRPDKAGMMSYFVDSKYGKTLFVTETREKAFDQNTAALQELLEIAEKEKKPVILARKSGEASMMIP